MRVPQLLLDHGVVSGMSVIIGPLNFPWGVLGTHSRRKMKFTVADSNFIQSVAVILWHAIERKKAEDALQQADRRKDEILAVLGHELRNPISCFVAALEIAGNSRDPSSVEQSHAVMARQVGRLGRLVDDLLEVSRIAKGELELKKKTVELMSTGSAEFVI